MGFRPNIWRPVARIRHPVTTLVLASLAMGCGHIDGRDGEAQYNGAVAPLLRQSTSVEPEERAAALAALDNLGRSALPGLVEALRGPLARDAVCELARIGEPAIPALVESLGTEDAQASWFILEGLRRIGAPAVPSLREALRTRDRSTRVGAACVLGFIGKPAAEAAGDLVRALQDVDPEVRSSAALALSRIGQPVGAGILAALDDKDATVRVSAASVLAFGGERKRAIPVLVAALGNGNTRVQRQAATCLMEVGLPATSKLVESLAQGSPQTREWAARILGRLGTEAPEAAPNLLRALEDDNAKVRLAAAIALCRLGHRTERVVSPLVLALGAEATVNEENGGLDAAYELSRIGPLSVRGLTSQLEHAGKQARDYASLALARIGSPAVVELGMLLESGKTAELRRAAARTLAMMAADASGAVPLLCRSLGDEDVEVRLCAAQSLGNIGPGATAAVRRLALRAADVHEDVRVRRAAILGLAGIGHAGPLETRVLLEALKDGNPDIRSSAALGLGRIFRENAEEALPGLLKALKDTSPWIRASAAQALGYTGDGSERVRSALVEVLGDENTDVRQRASSALDQIQRAERKARARQLLMSALGEDEAVWGPPDLWRDSGFLLDVGQDELPYLLQALRYRNPEVRRLVVECLGRIGSAATLRELIQAINDPDLNVQSAAIYALGNMGPAAALATLDLVQAMRQGLPPQRQAACWALGRVTSEWNVAVGPLIRVLNRDSDAAVRASAAQGLQELAGPRREVVNAIERALGARAIVDWKGDHVCYSDWARIKDLRMIRDETLASERRYRGILTQALSRVKCSTEIGFAFVRVDE